MFSSTGWITFISSFPAHCFNYVRVSCFARVKSSYPEEAGYVDKRKKELDKMWKDLKVHTTYHCEKTGLQDFGPGLTQTDL